MERTDRAPYRIFIVEDDSGIAAELQKYLGAWGMEVRCVQDFHAVMEEFRAFAPQLVLLDISLPFMGGYYWCRELRRESNVPIIFISSAADNMNIIMAVNMGADDFVAKPFDADVLVAKLQALLRRTYDLGSEAPSLSHRGAVLHSDDNSLVFQEQKISLSKNEYRILHTLLQSKGKIVSRERLMQTLWETDSFVDENTLTVNVGRLRKRLDAAGLTDFIETKFGLGYLIAEDEP